MHPRDKFFRAEGLGQVIERTEIEPEVAGVWRGPGSEDNDGDGGRGRLAAEHFAHAQAIDVGQHEVEQDEIGPAEPDGFKRLTAAGRGLHVVSGFGKMETHEVGHVAFVVNTENKGCHADELHRSCGMVVARG